MFNKPKVPPIHLIKSLKSNTWESLIWTANYIYIYIDGGGGGMVGFEPQIGDTIKNVARLSLEPPKINLRG